MSFLTDKQLKQISTIFALLVFIGLTCTFIVYCYNNPPTPPKIYTFEINRVSPDGKIVKTWRIDSTIRPKTVHDWSGKTGISIGGNHIKWSYIYAPAGSSLDIKLEERKK